MPHLVRLPDSSELSFDQAPSVEDVASRIGPGLAKACVAGRIDGQRVDASEPVPDGASVEILTAKDPDGLEVVRHSCAHLLAHALKQLWPDARLAIGPTIEDGFYYDIDMEHRLTPEDLETLQQRMDELARADYQVVREVVSAARAGEVFAQRSEPYKQEIVAGIPEGETIALYHHQEYVDMCRGPHVTNTRHLRAFRLTHLAGAYWRGDSDKPMLQRIYGTAWPSRAELDEHLRRREEARHRDHRLLGRRMGLFHFQEEAPGMAFWHAEGVELLRRIEASIREGDRADGYQEVRTPQMMDMELWRRSGHAEKFGENMFVTGSEKRDYAVKPMNCPGHCQIFNSELRSYRQLPLRMAEFGLVHRNEPSGTLHGLMRVRAFTQDDAHVFCTREQVQAEVLHLIDRVFHDYRMFGFEDIEIRLATRPEQRVGSDDDWDQTERALREALEQAGHPWELNEGEGAFYGPKLEFSLRDCLGRLWQCGTVQLDFSMPQRLGVRYVDENSDTQHPVMIHRAILGSLERFTGILVEHHAGALPLWLSPRAAVVLPIADRHAESAGQLAGQLREAGLRVEVDARNEKVGYKIREHLEARVPYMLVVGDRELEQQSVAVRRRNADLGTMSRADLAAMLADELRSRSGLSAGLQEPSKGAQKEKSQ